MKQSIIALSALSAVVQAADVTWCKDSECGDCPSGITTSGPGYPECVIYDSDTVFGGQGFEPGTEEIKFLVHGDFADPCGGAPGSYIVRSPASLTQNGCGNLAFSTQTEQCSEKLPIKDTFMVQFCCGEGDCTAAGVPWGKRDGSSGTSGGSMRLAYKNGTEIQPLAVGSPPDMQTMRRGDRLDSRQCSGFRDPYEPSGDSYLTTKDTQIVSASVAATEEERSIRITYDQSVSRTTGFSLSVGDPWGIMTATTSFEFTNEERNGFQVDVTVPAGISGRVGFTPVYRCTSGTLGTCDGGRTTEQESCTPYVQNGIVQGDYQIVQSYVRRSGPDL